MAVIEVERKSLTLAERTYIPQILSGLKTTWKRMLAPNVTLSYPEQRPEILPGYRGVPTLVRDYRRDLKDLVERLVLADSPRAGG